jgi:hypothetical protein
MPYKTDHVLFSYLVCRVDHFPAWCVCWIIHDFKIRRLASQEEAEQDVTAANREDKTCPWNSTQGCGYVLSRPRGVDTFFKTLAKLARSSEFFTRKVRKQLAQYINCQWVGKKPSPGWRVGWYFYSPILNSTRIWRVQGGWLTAPLFNHNKIYMYRFPSIDSDIKFF